MHWPWIFTVYLLFQAVNCLSSSGSRLLVVVEEAAEKSRYSKFWGDLEGKVCHVAMADHARLPGMLY